MNMHRVWPMMFAVLLYSCSNQTVKAPVEDRTGRTSIPVPPPPPTAVAIPLKPGGPGATYHEVVSGDTIRSIAGKYGQDYRMLAKRNHIKPPYTIQIGDQLRVAPYPEESATALEMPGMSRDPITRYEPSPQAGLASTARSPVIPDGTPVEWQWPMNGPLLSEFKANTESQAGINIAGRVGQIVYAAADGQVIYTGDGLVGYGRLIIVKHSQNFLSAYAHNRKLLAREGDQLEVGQPIAQLGGTTTGNAKLHFEIRRDGMPVDPLRYLPER